RFFSAPLAPDDLPTLSLHDALPISATAAEGLVFYDAWVIAGDGTPGYTWSNRNPLAAVGMYPDRRFDYILSAWPRLGAVDHPTRSEEHTSELQSPCNLVCRLLLEKK